MPKIDIKSLPSLFGKILESRKNIAIFCAVFSLMIYVITWQILAASAKRELTSFLKSQKDIISYQSLSMGGFPFGFKATISEPIIRLDFDKKITSLISKTNLAKLFATQQDFFNFSWNKKYYFQEKIIVSIHPFSANYEIIAKGDIKSETELNGKELISNISYATLNFDVDFDSGLMEQTLAPLASIEEFRKRINGINMEITDLKETDISLNNELYSIKSLIVSNEIVKKHKLDSNFDIHHKITYKGSKYSKYNDQYINDLYNLPVVAFTLDKLEIYNPFTSFDRLASKRGVESGEIEFFSEFDYLNLPTISFRIVDFHKNNDLIEYNATGKFSYIKGDDEHIVRITTDIIANPEETWHSYIEETQAAEKNTQQMTLESLNKHFKDKGQETPKILKTTLYKFSSINPNKAAKGFIFKLYNKQEVKLGAQINYELNMLETIADIQRIYFNTNGFTVEASGKAVGKSGDEFYGNFDISILDYKVLAEKIYAILSNNSEVQATLPANQNGNLIIAKLLQDFSDAQNSSDDNIVIMMENEKGFPEVKIGDYTKTRAIDVIKQTLVKVIDPKKLQTLFASSVATPSENKTDLKADKEACYTAGKNMQIDGIKISCETLALDTDDAKAQYYYGRYLLNSDSKDHNESLAFALLKKSADANFRPAYSKLAYLYEKEPYKDLKLAERWHLKSYYEKQDSESAEEIAIFYNNPAEKEFYNHIKSTAWYLVSYKYDNKDSLKNVREILMKTNDKKELREKDFYAAKSMAEKIVSNFH